MKRFWVWLNEMLHGYCVQVYWEGDWYVHESRTIEGAVQWIKAYPKDACCAIVSYGSDKIVQSRGFVVSRECMSRVS